MRLIFIDDSGQRSPRREHLGELVSVGAVMFPEDQVAVYSRAIDQLRTEIGMPGGEEFKWKPSRGSWLASAGGNVVKGMRRRMLEIAGQCGVRTAVVIWDRGRVDWDKEYAANEILGYLYERIEMELKTTDERGVVIADVPGGGSKDHTKWLAEALDLTTVGTAYVKPDRVVMPIVTAPSDHVPHLQLADLVCAATTAAVAGLPHGLELIDLLKPLARRNAYGRIGGAGLALVPREPLVDLYFWCSARPSTTSRASALPSARPTRPFPSRGAPSNATTACRPPDRTALSAPPTRVFGRVRVPVKGPLSERAGKVPPPMDGRWGSAKFHTTNLRQITPYHVAHMCPSPPSRM